MAIVKARKTLIKQDVLTQELSWQDEFGTCY